MCITKPFLHFYIKRRPATRRQPSRTVAASHTVAPTTSPVPRPDDGDAGAGIIERNIFHGIKNWSVEAGDTNLYLRLCRASLRADDDARAASTKKRLKESPGTLLQRAVERRATKRRRNVRERWTYPSVCGRREPSSCARARWRWCR